LSTAVWAQRSIPARRTATAVVTEESGRAVGRAPTVWHEARRWQAPAPAAPPTASARYGRPVARRQQRRGPSGLASVRAQRGADACRWGFTVGGLGDLSLARSAAAPPYVVQWPDFFWRRARAGAGAPPHGSASWRPVAEGGATAVSLCRPRVLRSRRHRLPLRTGRYVQQAAGGGRAAYATRART